MRAVISGLAGAAAMALMAGACAPEPRDLDAAMDPEEGARMDFVNLCSDCHGPGGKGDGRAAPGMVPPPSDLTTISARNGGVFPKAQVAGHIYGHTMGRSDSPMPQFGDLFAGPEIMYETGKDQVTPTPARLAALTDYLAENQE
ncbi:cytochrome c [uncultured Paracoccus sp.]|uniref:c-type cytochrome n=1 Tax=uncultured Paracoccus sp. TaxID=189685 RepID=UPI0026300A4D|nr:cytochrome c [uncultured Paracoccus sp.]